MQGYEVIYLTGVFDEYVMQQLPVYVANQLTALAQNNTQSCKHVSPPPKGQYSGKGLSSTSIEAEAKQVCKTADRLTIVLTACAPTAPSKATAAAQL